MSRSVVQPDSLPPLQDGSRESIQAADAPFIFEKCLIFNRNYYFYNSPLFSYGKEVYLLSLRIKILT